MSEPRNEMTRAEQIAAVLADHQTEQIWKAGGWAGDTGCSCGWRMGMWSRNDFPPVHRAHVAEALSTALAHEDGLTERVRTVLDGYRALSDEMGGILAIPAPTVIRDLRGALEPIP